MPKLIDFLTFKDKAATPRDIQSSLLDERPRKAELDAACSAANTPADGADIESISEYRLASLMQYPHY